MNTHDQIRALLPSLHGWCEVDKAVALYDLVRRVKPKIVLEVGVWGGRSLFPMAMAVKENGSGTVFAVDPWSPEASAVGQTTEADEKWWGDQNHELVYQHFLYNSKKLGLDQVIRVIREKSVDVEPPKDIDVLHLDGNHGPDAIADAKSFAANVKLGGYCILDDLGWAGGNVQLAETVLKELGFTAMKPLGTGAIYQRMEIGKAEQATSGIDVRSPLQREESINDRLTVAFVTSRVNSRVEWFLDSLANNGFDGNVIIVDLHCSPSSPVTDIRFKSLSNVPPKPTIWQGSHRITGEDWWAVSNARNTAIALCKTEWIALVDDRCVLMPGWLEATHDAIKGGYLVCGSYQKRVGMVVQDGFIVNGGRITGEDHRLLSNPAGLDQAPGNWVFGCTLALPVEWALAVNGYSEDFCDGMSFEDCIFGMHIQNNGFRIKYDPRMRIIEDRTTQDLGTAMKRTSKEKHPNDKTDKCHTAIARLKDAKESGNSYSLRTLREKVLAGAPFPPPSASHKDWFDGQPISEMK